MKFDFQAMAAKAKEVLATATEKTSKAAKDLREKADKAAEVVAAKCEITGRASRKVKRTAVIVAGVAMGPSRSQPPEAEAARRATAVDRRAAEWLGNDLSSKSFAEMGWSLNTTRPRRFMQDNLLRHGNDEHPDLALERAATTGSCR
jgi:hypothetical protein